MKHAALILLLTVMLAGMEGCSKDGNTGPAGKDGNANVHTTTFVVTPADWHVSASVGLGEINCSLTDTNLTAGILDSGSIEVFQQLGYSEPLPITDVGSAPWGNWLTITTAGFGTHAVQIRRYRNDDSLPGVPSYNTSYKVVVIEGRK